MDVVDDLVAEQDRLEAILAALDDAAWRSPSGAPGWTVADVVLHLAQTEEAVVASATGAASPLDRPRPAGSLDAVMDQLVQAERDEPPAVFERWRTARRAAVAALLAADPQQPLAWAAAPLKPRTLATTRLAEHWAHGLDVTEPLGIAFPDTDRLRHVAWLAHGSLPYAFLLAGEQAQPVRCELVAPDGANVDLRPGRRRVDDLRRRRRVLPRGRPASRRGALGPRRRGTGGRHRPAPAAELRDLTRPAPRRVTRSQAPPTRTAASEGRAPIDQAGRIHAGPRRRRGGTGARRERIR